MQIAHCIFALNHMNILNSDFELNNTNILSDILTTMPGH